MTAGLLFLNGNPCNVFGRRKTSMRTYDYQAFVSMFYGP